MTAEREMSLTEWCAKLPETHKVNKQLRRLVSDSTILEALYAGGVHSWEWYYDSLRDAGLLNDDDEEDEE